MEKIFVQEDGERRELTGAELEDFLKQRAEDEAEAIRVESQRAYVEALRAQAYRETSDPLFFQYQRGTASEKEWLDAVQAVKDAHPYPEEV